MAAIPRATIMVVEIFGGYLVGRTLIRNRIDHKNYFRYLTIVFAVLLPFAVLEMLTGFNTRAEDRRHRPHRSAAAGQPRPAARHQPGEGDARASHTCSAWSPRWASRTCSTSTASSLSRRWRGRGLFVFMTFISLSTGPLLSVLCQLGLIAWDRTLAFLRFRWLLLVYLALFGVLLVRIGAEFHLRDFIVNDVSYARASAESRLVDLGLRPDGGEAASGLRHRPERLDAALVARRARPASTTSGWGRRCASACRRSSSWRWPGGRLRADRDAEDALAGGGGLPAGLSHRPWRASTLVLVHRLHLERHLRLRDDLYRRRRLVLPPAPGGRRAGTPRPGAVGPPRRAPSGSAPASAGGGARMTGPGNGEGYPRDRDLSQAPRPPVAAGAAELLHPAGDDRGDGHLPDADGGLDPAADVRAPASGHRRRQRHPVAALFAPRLHQPPGLHGGPRLRRSSAS